MKWWQRNVDKTIRCTCKVVDFLIKLIDWPYYASRIRRKSWRAVVSSTLSIWLRFVNWARHLSGEYSQIRKTQLTGKRISYGISSQQVVWIRLIKHKQALKLPMSRPFYECVLLPWGVTAWLQPREEFANIWQGKRVGIIAIKNKERECTFNRRFDRYSRRGILNSLTWGLDGWRNKITSGHRTRTFRSLCLNSLMTHDHYNVRCFNWTVSCTVIYFFFTTLR